MNRRGADLEVDEGRVRVAKGEFAQAMAMTAATSSKTPPKVSLRNCASSQLRSSSDGLARICAWGMGPG